MKILSLQKYIFYQKFLTIIHVIVLGPTIPTHRDYTNVMPTDIHPKGCISLAGEGFSSHCIAIT